MLCNGQSKNVMNNCVSKQKMFFSFTLCSAPVISQWAIFAIRNILENCVENQEVVQALKRQGVADDSILKEMGYKMEDRDGNMLLRPLKKDH